MICNPVLFPRFTHDDSRQTLFIVTSVWVYFQNACEIAAEIHLMTLFVVFFPECPPAGS